MWAGSTSGGDLCIEPLGSGFVGASVEVAVNIEDRPY